MPIFCGKIISGIIPAIRFITIIHLGYIIITNDTVCMHIIIFFIMKSTHDSVMAMPFLLYIIKVSSMFTRSAFGYRYSAKNIFIVDKTVTLLVQIHVPETEYTILHIIK